MLTKGAIGNLVNRYKAVLAKCNLMNTFGSLAVAAMLVMGGAGVASAVEYSTTGAIAGNVNINDTSFTYSVTGNSSYLCGIYGSINSDTINIYSDGGGIDLHGDLTITSKDITVENKKYAAFYVGNGGSGTDLKIITDNLTILGREGFITGIGKTVTVEATNNVIIDNTYTGIWGYGDVKINAKNISIEADNNRAIESANDSLANDVQISLTASESISISGNITSNYSSDITIDAKSTAIIGDLKTQNSGSTITANFNGSESFLKGTVTDNSSGISLGLSNGGLWTATGESSVNKLTLNGGIIDMSGTEGNIDITNLAGKGGEVVMDASKSNTLEIANATNTVITAVASENADSVTEAQAKKMVERIAGVTNKSAFIEEGDVNGAISIDAKGNVSTAKNTLMDAALKQASITTVALDKILTNDVRKRLGDIRSDKNQTGVWMRWDGGKLKGDGLTNNFNTIQIGGDTKVGTNCRIGVAGSFTHGDTDFARGNGELEGFSFALYSTWMGENGMFADIVTRLGHFSNEMNVEGRKGDMDNRVFSLSGEYGWRFDLCKQFFLEPQVELAYTYVSSDDLQLGTARYAFDNVNSLVGRAGLVAGWNLPDDMGSVYARASVLQQFMGDAKIIGANGGKPITQEIDGNDTWLEYGIGANIKLTDKTYIWADVERTAGADLDEEWRGTVGLRYSF